MSYFTRIKYSFSCKNQLLLLEPPVIFPLQWVINPDGVTLASFLLLWPQRQHPQCDARFLRWSWGHMLLGSLGHPLGFWPEKQKNRHWRDRVAARLRSQSSDPDTRWNISKLAAAATVQYWALPRTQHCVKYCCMDLVLITFPWSRWCVYPHFQVSDVKGTDSRPHSS